MSSLRTASLGRFLSDLAAAAEADPLARKAILAPSRRAGHQWIEQLARAGRALLNIEVETLASLAAGTLSRASGAGPPLRPAIASSIAVENLLGRARREGVPYLSGLVHSLGLIRRTEQTLGELRMAGVEPAQIRAARFEREDKAAGLAWLLDAWESGLEAAGEIDQAGLLRRAAQAAAEDPATVPADCVLLPAGLRVTGAEAAFVEALRPRLTRLSPGDVQDAGPGGDVRLLAWFQQPASAPPPSGGEAVMFHTARGEINEVRHALRRCLAENTPLDEIELLYTDAGAYAPMLYETMELLSGAAPESWDELPVTFAEGIPIRYGRPARALAEWLAWRRDSFSQARAVTMVREGLITAPSPGTSASRLAGTLRGAPVVFGRERYIEQLETCIEASERRAERDGLEMDDAGEPIELPSFLIEERRRLSELRALFADLLSITPEASDGPARVLECARAFLRDFAGSVTKFDAYVKRHLLDVVDGMTQALERYGTEGLDAAGRLEDEARTACVGGHAPQPGKLHAASVANGGHSGRGRLILIGLDDRRFPPGASQDPLLLDHERLALSPDLETSAQGQQRRMDELAALFARQRGTAALSYSIESVTDGSPRAPSPALLGAYRVASGDPQADPADLLRAAGATASFAPADANEALTGGEWWTARLDEVSAAEVEGAFPLFAQGKQAQSRRGEPQFTEYDGHVPASAETEGLTRAGAPVVSAHRLETLGACPRRYFYRYVLGIQPLEDIEPEPALWLDAREAGSLIHEVFRSFMAAIADDAAPVNMDTHWPIMKEAIERAVARKRRERPPRTAGAVERQRRIVQEAARMFLAEESRRPTGVRPLYFEASVGMESGDSTPLDTVAPVELPLNGGALRLRGRIDRVDQLAGRERPEFRLLDYKTGGTSRYQKIHKDPFLKGRLIQHALYIWLSEPGLKAIHGAHAQVRRFSYFFPGERGAGRVLTWRPGQLAEGREVLQGLCAIVDAGAYGPTDSRGDCDFCDYAPICGAANVIAGQGAAMLTHGENAALHPFQALRQRGKTS